MSSFWGLQIFNSLAYGALLFLTSAGLSLIFGVMKIINIAHGSFYLLGAYFALWILSWSGNFVVAVLLSAVLVALIGVIMHRYFLDWLGEQVLPQIVITMGFALLFQDMALWIWGGNTRVLASPSYLRGAVNIAGLIVPKYRVFLIVCCAVLGVIIWYVVERTKIGALVRAIIDNREMARGTGVRVNLVATGVFAVGALIAGLGGALGSAYLGMNPTIHLQILPLSFAVIIIGGIGSIPGTVVGALIIGLFDTMGRALFPELSYFTLFVPVVAMLALRPQGLIPR